MEKGIELTLTHEEQQAFLQLLDIALRNHGLGAFDVVQRFRAKLDDAEREARENGE